MAFITRTCCYCRKLLREKKEEEGFGTNYLPFFFNSIKNKWEESFFFPENEKVSLSSTLLNHITQNKSWKEQHKCMHVIPKVAAVVKLSVNLFYTTQNRKSFYLKRGSTGNMLYARRGSTQQQPSR